MKHRALHNSQPATPDQWRDLFAAYQVENRRLAAVSEFDEVTHPNPRATERDLTDAEQRLGHPLQEEIRIMLSVANGWEDYTVGCSILGTADIAQGPRWAALCESLDIFQSNGPEDFFEYHLGITDDERTVTDPVIFYREGYQLEAFTFSGLRSGTPAHGVFCLGGLEDENSPWPDLYTYLHEGLDEIRDFIRHEELGPHSRVWERDIRADPPNMADIVDKLSTLADRLGKQQVERSSGATVAALEALEQTLGNPLSQTHRELLSVTDGMWAPYVGRVLSVAEILDREDWERVVGLALDAAANPWYQHPPFTAGEIVGLHSGHHKPGVDVREFLLNTIDDVYRAVLDAERLAELLGD